jgi:hypothetical protein
MPARRVPIKSRHRRTSCASGKINDEKLTRALKAIERERDNLSRAESLLSCLKIAMEHEEISHRGPYYPDVAEIAREMVRKSIGALDPINLPDPSRNRVKEDFSAGDREPAAVVRCVPLLPRPLFALSQRCSLRTHRRNYSRVSARNASSSDSTFANISGCVAR